MKPIPNEMRKRILDDCNNGMNEVAAAEKWGVSPSFITKLKRHVRETGAIDPKNGKTGPKRKLESCRELLQQIVDQTPDATLEKIREQLPLAVSIQRFTLRYPFTVSSREICKLFFVKM